jgi:hypothetical protein
VPKSSSSHYSVTPRRGSRRPRTQHRAAPPDWQAARRPPTSRDTGRTRTIPTTTTRSPSNVALTATTMMMLGHPEEGTTALVPEHQHNNTSIGRRSLRLTRMHRRSLSTTRSSPPSGSPHTTSHAAPYPAEGAGNTIAGSTRAFLPGSMMDGEPPTKDASGIGSGLILELNFSSTPNFVVKAHLQTPTRVALSNPR